MLSIAEFASPTIEKKVHFLKKKKYKENISVLIASDRLVLQEQ